MMSELQLRKTRLVLRDTNVCKFDNDGSIVARFPLGAINDVRVESRAEYAVPAVIVLFFGALAVVCKLYLPSPGWSWVAVFFCLGIIGFGLVGISTHRLIIETKEGAVSFPFTERLADVQGFAVSVKLLASGKSPVGVWQATDGDASIILEFERGPWEGTYKQIVENGGKSIREFGSWAAYTSGVQMLIMATDIPSHPRFGINTEYNIDYLDSNRIRINGPDRANLLFTRAPDGLRIDFDETNVLGTNPEHDEASGTNDLSTDGRIG